MTTRSIGSSVEIIFRNKDSCAEVIFSTANNNTLNSESIFELTEAFQQLATHPTIRSIVLSSLGDKFCSGIDLHWMLSGAESSLEENHKSAGTLGRLFKQIHDSPFPTIAKVQGDAIGAGLGLVGACDICITANTAQFTTREVRNGILPALMSPYVIGAIGARIAKYMFLTSRPLTAKQALEYGLAHVVCEADDLADEVGRCIHDLSLGSPASLAATKNLVEKVEGRTIDEALIEETIDCIAQFRSTNSALSGLRNVIKNIPAPWVYRHDC